MTNHSQVADHVTHQSSMPGWDTHNSSAELRSNGEHTFGSNAIQRAYDSNKRIQTFQELRNFQAASDATTRQPIHHGTIDFDHNQILQSYFHDISQNNIATGQLHSRGVGIRAYQILQHRGFDLSQLYHKQGGKYVNNFLYIFKVEFLQIYRLMEKILYLTQRIIRQKKLKTSISFID